MIDQESVHDDLSEQDEDHAGEYAGQMMEKRAKIEEASD